MWPRRAAAGATSACVLYPIRFSGINVHRAIQASPSSKVLRPKVWREVEICGLVRQHLLSALRKELAARVCLINPPNSPA